MLQSCERDSHGKAGIQISSDLSSKECVSVRDAVE